MESIKTIEDLDRHIELRKTNSSWKDSFKLLRASWSTLKLDKELVSLSWYSALTSLALFIIVGLVVWGTGLVQFNFSNLNSETDPITLANQYIGWGLLFTYYLITYLTANFFTAAIVAGAIKRFEGGDPTIGYSLERARAKFWPIFYYSVFAATIGTVLDKISQNVPMVGKIVVVITGAAWSVVSVFAIPAIVTSKTNINPLEATKQSVGIFKKVWADNFIGNLGLGLAFLGFLLIWVLLLIGSLILGLVVNPISFLITAPILLASLVVMITILNTLTGIFHAALYHFAITGEAPGNFDKRLLQSAFKPKTSWFA